MLDGEERAGEVHVDGALPGGQLEAVGPVVVVELHRGVRHDHVQAAERLGRLGDGTLDLRLDRDVGPQLAVGERLEVDARDARALLLEPLGDGAADAAARARDERPAPREATQSHAHFYRR